MYTGWPPFHGCNLKREELINKIKYENVKFPIKVTSELKDMLEKLFEKNPNKRLGSIADA